MPIWRASASAVGGGTDVGGVGSQQTQDTGALDASLTALEAERQAQRQRLTALGWTDNGVGGMTSMDGASHWGTRARSPFAVINYPHVLRRAAQQAQARRSNDDGDADGPDCTGPDPPNVFCGSGWCGPDPGWIDESDEDDKEITPYERKYQQYVYCNTRTGDLADLINDEWDRKVFVDGGYVVYQQDSAMTWTHIMSRTGAHLSSVQLRECHPTKRSTKNSKRQRRWSLAKKARPPQLTRTLPRSHWGHMETGHSRYEQGWWRHLRATLSLTEATVIAGR